MVYLALFCLLFCERIDIYDEFHKSSAQKRDALGCYIFCTCLPLFVFLLREDAYIFVIICFLCCVCKCKYLELQCYVFICFAVLSVLLFFLEPCKFSKMEINAYNFPSKTCWHHHIFFCLLSCKKKQSQILTVVHKPNQLCKYFSVEIKFLLFSIA